MGVQEGGGCVELIRLPTHVELPMQEEERSSPQGSLCKKAPNTGIVINVRYRTVLTAGQFVQEGRRQDVINHPSGQEERQVIFCAGHIQLEIIHTVQQALEALLHLISLDDLVVQAGQQVCCHLMLPEEPE